MIDQVDQPADRERYAAQATRRGWSLRVLQHQIATDPRGRTTSAPSN